MLALFNLSAKKFVSLTADLILPFYTADLLFVCYFEMVMKFNMKINSFYSQKRYENDFVRRTSVACLEAFASVSGVFVIPSLVASNLCCIDRVRWNRRIKLAIRSVWKPIIASLRTFPMSAAEVESRCQPSTRGIRTWDVTHLLCFSSASA
jgi:hypothetical protein